GGSVAPGVGSPSMTGADAILFDLYDTLVWSDWPSHDALIASRLGVSADTVTGAYDLLRHQRDTGIHNDVAAVLGAVAEACGVEPEPELIADLAAREASFLASEVRWYDDSLAVLHRLRTRGFKTGLISNCSASTRPLVDRLGLESETDVVVLSCELGEMKPAAAIFTTALDALAVTPDRAVFVDDRADYLDGAARLGMATFRIARNVSFGEEMPGGDHRLITSLDELERQV
ncbi:MAG: HAD family hydrolase, partial [Acidimicrobiia bacterium]